MNSITHSGATFMCLGVGDRYGAPVWPIDEYLVRTNHGPNVTERIRRLNPHGKEEGVMPRGVYLKRVSKRRLKARARLRERN